MQRQALQASLEEVAQPEFDLRFETGQYEVLQQGSKLRGSDLDPLDVCQVRWRDGEVQRVVLPRQSFPELYDLRAEIVWLEQEIPRRPTGANPADGQER